MRDDNAEGASEADIIEQEQDAGGSVNDSPNVSSAEANVADALEQGATVDGDEDDYPHRAESTEEPPA